MLSCTFSMFWTTVTSQTSSEKRRTNRHTVKPTVMFGSRAGFAKGSHTLPCFHNAGPGVAGQLPKDLHFRLSPATPVPLPSSPTAPSPTPLPPHSRPHSATTSSPAVPPTQEPRLAAQCPGESMLLSPLQIMSVMDIGDGT